MESKRSEIVELLNKVFLLVNLPEARFVKFYSNKDGLAILLFLFCLRYSFTRAAVHIGW